MQQYSTRVRPRLRPNLMAGLRLRPPCTTHSHDELELMRRAASGASTVVELGVAEGVSAAVMRPAMKPGGTLVLVDPFITGRSRVSWSRVVARRLLAGTSGARLEWLEMTSSEALDRRIGDIDVLNCDARHHWEGLSDDWVHWSPRVRVGGTVIFPNDVTPGSADVLTTLGATGWEAVERASERTLLRRLA